MTFEVGARYFMLVGSSLVVQGRAIMVSDASIAVSDARTISTDGRYPWERQVQLGDGEDVVDALVIRREAIEMAVEVLP